MRILAPLVAAALLLAGLTTTAAQADICSPGQSDICRVSGYSWRNVQIVGGGFVDGIVFSPTEPGLAYARTDIGGAYRWDPAARRWVPLMDSTGFDDWNELGVESIATDPVDPARVWVAAGEYTQPWAVPLDGEILRSDDQGSSLSLIHI